MKSKILLSPAFCCALLLSTSINAQTTTTTTTTTNPDGSVTTQETTTQEPTTTTGSSPSVLGPKGVAGTLRRVERRDDYRKEQDLEQLEDALEDRPRPRR